MAAGNRSPLGFGVITLFFLCVLGAWVFLQVAYDRWGFPAFLGLGNGFLVCAVVVGIVARRFYWDLFRSFKSAAVLISMLVVACVLGTLLIQDLDLRRADVFETGEAAPGEIPKFDDRYQSSRFALAESHAIQWLMPSEERVKMTEEKVNLSEVEEAHVKLRGTAFGERSATAHREAILGSKQRQVDQLTTSNYARENWDSLYNFWLFCRKLHLFDIFEAWWFYALLACIAITNITGTIARAPWSVRDCGIAITHAGLIIILAGALTDLIAAKEGYIYFTDGKPEMQAASQMGDNKNRVYYHLPFQVYLDRFSTEYYHEMAVERYDHSRRHDGSPMREGERARVFSTGKLFPVREGIARLYEGGKVKVVVHEYKPRVVVKTNIADIEDGPLNPAVKLGLYNRPEGGRNFFVHGSSDPWLFANDNRATLDRFDSRFEYIWARNDVEYRALLAAAPMPDNGTLVLRTGSDVARAHVALGERANIKVGSRTVQVEFVTIRSAFADSKNVNLDRRLQTSEEPILYLRLGGQLLPVPRDDSEFTRDFNILDGVDFRFDWPDPKDAGVRAIYRVVDAEGRQPALVQADVDGSPVVAPMQRGRPIPLRRLEGAFLGIEGRVRSAREERVVDEITDVEWLGDIGGDEIELSGVLKAYLGGRGEEGQRMEKVCRDLLQRERRLPPHILAAWRSLLVLVEQQEPQQGGGELRAEWEAHLKKERSDLVAAWQHFFGDQRERVNDRLLAAWADVEVTGPWGTVRRELTPYDPPILYGPKGQPIYRFAIVQTQQARDWFSVLSVIDRQGWKVATHPAQVNSPLRHGGYRFFQATAATDRDGLGVSGISVTRNPGVKFMYVGYTILTLGVCYIFFLRPILDRRRRSRRRQEVAA